MELREGAGIDVGAGVLTSSWMDVGGDVTVSRGGQLCFGDGVRFYNGAAVTVTDGGMLQVTMNQLQMDGGVSLVNDSHVFFDGWEMWQFNLDGEIVNRSGGYLGLCGEPMINGALRNEGTLELHWGLLHIQGRLNNQGTAYTNNSEAGYQGNWSGRGFEHR